jgi:hypothetical protein
VLIETLSVPSLVTNAANVTAASITEPVPTITKPSGDGVLVLGDGGQQTASAIKLVFFGVGSDSNTFVANVYGWEIVPGAGVLGDSDLWVPVLLASFTGITLDSTQPGLAGTLVGATQYFATGITLGTGNQGVGLDVVSGGHVAHEIAHVIIDMKGARLGEVRYGTGSSATSCNGLWRKL